MTGDSKTQMNEVWRAVVDATDPDTYREAKRLFVCFRREHPLVDQTELATMFSRKRDICESGAGGDK